MRCAWASSPRPTPRACGMRTSWRTHGTATCAPCAATSTHAAPAWLYHHLTITGPPADVAAFAEAARGPGVIPWHLNYAQIEEDIFHRAVAARGGLSIEGCHILARQFCQRIESRAEKAVALIGQSR